MSDQNRCTLTLAITPPPTDGGDALAFSTVGSTAQDTLQSAGELLHLTLNVETLGQDIIRITAVDALGRSYEGSLSLRLTNRAALCYVCDANGCRWVSPCA